MKVIQRALLPLTRNHKYITLGKESVLHLAQEGVVRLVLCRHEHNQDPVEELQALERRKAHVEEDAEQHGHWNVLQRKNTEQLLIAFTKI
jgi:hypothetical protein